MYYVGEMQTCNLYALGYDDTMSRRLCVLQIFIFWKWRVRSEFGIRNSVKNSIHWEVKVTSNNQAYITLKVENNLVKAYSKVRGISIDSANNTHIKFYPIFP